MENVIVEVGPGAGRYDFNPFVSPGLDVVYIDVDPPRRKLSSASWVVADAQHLPLRDGVIDRIYAMHVVEHLDQPALFFKECHRVLKKNGVLLVAVPNFLSVNAYADPDHKHVFNFFKLRGILRNTGFATRHSYGINLGSLLPRYIRKIIAVLLALLSDELVMVGIKQ